MEQRKTNPSLGRAPGSRTPARDDTPRWVPFFIGAAILVVCGIGLLIGATLVFGNSSSSRTPTRLALSPTRPPVTVIAPPTATPTPVPVIAKISATTANVRAEPRTIAKILATVKKNEAITLLGQASGEKVKGSEKDTWYLINLAGGGSGWIFVDTLEIASGDPQTLPMVTPTPKP